MKGPLCGRSAESKAVSNGLQREPTAAFFFFSLGDCAAFGPAPAPAPAPSAPTPISTNDLFLALRDSFKASSRFRGAVGSEESVNEVQNGAFASMRFVDR